MKAQRRGAIVWLDRGITGILAALLFVLLAGFGGAVWWARLALVGGVTAIGVLAAARAAMAGGGRVVASPLVLAGAAALGLAIVQLAPLPGSVASRLAPRARAAHALGTLPDRVEHDLPGADLPDVGGLRTPATVDRAATLRWLVTAAGCLAVLAVVLHHTDRLDRTLTILGAIVAPLFLGTTVGLVQWIVGSDQLLGVVEPGVAPAWGPNALDRLGLPGTTLLRAVGPAGSWALAHPDPQHEAGALLGGCGGYLALSALALPLALALVLQTVAPRGCREPLRERLRGSDRGGLAALLLVLTLLSATLTGVLGGRVLIGPIAIGLVLAGVPAWSAGLRWIAPGATALVVAALLFGTGLRSWTAPAPRDAVQASSLPPLPQVEAERWRESVRIARDFPLLGAGLGSFATVEPYYKTQDEAATTAGSSVLQWCAEGGLAGLAVLGMAVLTVVLRVPRALRRVGSADCPLGFGLLGALAGFLAFATLHWSVELTAIGVAACAVLGATERWLAGGTDLFVEPA